jgi:hypothetical protein
MTMPAFTAEASLYKTSGHYQSRSARQAVNSSARRVSPIWPAEVINVRDCRPGCEKWEADEMWGCVCFGGDGGQSGDGAGRGEGGSGSPGGGGSTPPPPPPPPWYMSNLVDCETFPNNVTCHECGVTGPGTIDCTRCGCAIEDSECLEQAESNRLKHERCTKETDDCASTYCDGLTRKALHDCQRNCVNIVGETGVCQSDPCSGGGSVYEDA